MTDKAMKDPVATEQASDRAELVNAVGLHPRPSVKLAQLAKTFDCRVEIALSADGPWIDAKSPVKVMRVKNCCLTEELTESDRTFVSVNVQERR